MAQGYKVRKAAQVAAFFALKQGGRIPVLKLVKLLYLSDREHLQKFDFPILFDDFVSMEHGPVTSMTYNYIKGEKESKDEWDTFISGRPVNHSVSAKEGVTEYDLDELSRAEIKTLESVWQQFSSMDRFEIRDWTHDNCAEWEDPKKSVSGKKSIPLPYERVLNCLGKEHAVQIAAEIKDIRGIDTVLGAA